MTRLQQRSVPFRTSEYLRQQGVHPVLARLYSARGVRDMSELDDQLGKLLQPETLTGSRAAAVFLADAIAAGKKMVIVADYDCDGATACAVAVRGLRMLGARVDYIVPNRFEYGYGLTPEIVALAIRETSPDIIVTVDNGIASIDGVAAANAHHVPVVITDHHLPGATLPDAAVIVNPNQPGCGFSSKNLAGVGVMFYVLLALRTEMRQRGVFDQQSQPRLDTLLDLVALGTVADVVQLDSNNRILVAQGLRRMRGGRMHAGIAALFHVAGRDYRTCSPFDLGFAVGPRLNAAGRLTDMSIGIECLLTDDPARAQQLATELDNINRERRSIESDMQETALLHLDSFDPAERCTLAVFDESWHQGVIGIVASRLKERYFRPTFTFAPGDHGLIKGSGRSIPGFHLRDALDLVSKRAPGLIDKFGGHAMAAGMTLRADHFEQFQQLFEQVGQEWLGQAAIERVIETDGPLEAHYFSLDFIGLLAENVWGQGFAAPVFCDRFDIVQQRILKEKHLKLQLRKGPLQFDAIWFGHADMLPDQADCAFRLDINHYNGVSKVQLLIEHAEAADPA